MADALARAWARWRRALDEAIAVESAAVPTVTFRVVEG